MSNILAGLQDFLRAQSLLFREGLWPLFLIPGLLSLLYLPLSAVLSFFLLRGLGTYVHDNWVPGFLQSQFTLIVLSVFLWIVVIYLGFLLFRNVIMILYSPILGFLSEAAELKADDPAAEAQRQVIVQPSSIQRSRYAVNSQDGLDLRGEDEPLAVMPVK